MITINKNSSNIGHFDDLFSTGSYRTITTLIISCVESRNSERAFNYALVLADKMFFQGLCVF